MMDRLSPDIQCQILAFIGPHQYRWVAGINLSLRAAYEAVFPEKTTYFNVSTKAHAQLCHHDNRWRCKEQRQLCAIAARQGNLEVLQYLHSVGCAWDAFTRPPGVRFQQPPSTSCHPSNNPAFATTAISQDVHV
jgi:hypothetical protein